MGASPIQMPLRLPQTLHRLLKDAASREGISLNQYCLYLLARYSGGEESLNRKKGEDLLRFLNEAQALQKAMKPKTAQIEPEPPKDSLKARWRRLHAKDRSRTH